MLDQCSIDEEAVKIAEVYKPLNIVVMVSKAMPPHHLYEQGVTRAHLSIQSSHHHHNGTSRKPLLKYVEIVIKSIFLYYI